MLLKDPAVGGDPLRLKPDDALHTLGPAVVCDRPKAFRESFLVDLPSAGVHPFAVVDVPAGIHPPVSEGQLFLHIAVDHLDLVLLVCVEHLVIEMGAVGYQDRSQNFSVRAWEVSIHHPAAPKVGPLDGGPPIKKQSDQRGTYFFTAFQAEMGHLLTRLQTHLALLRRFRR